MDHNQLKGLVWVFFISFSVVHTQKKGLVWQNTQSYPNELKVKLYYQDYQ